MKAVWRRFQARIDAATLRERLLVFVSIAGLVVAVLNAAVIEPQMAAARRLSEDIGRKQADMRRMQDQIQKLAQRGSAPDEDRLRIERLRADLQQVNAEFAEREKQFATPAKVSRFVEELLTRNRGLSLVAMKNLPLTDLTGTPVAERKAAAPGAVVPARGLIYRHGIEVVVSGAYLDLLGYLADLEKLPTQVYWGSLELNAAEYPVSTLKFTLYTLSLDPTWMSV